MITIVDSGGNDVPVNNLALDLMQADDYRHYVYFNQARQLREGGKLHAYWEDRYHKLLRLELQRQNAQC